MRNRRLIFTFLLCGVFVAIPAWAEDTQAPQGISPSSNLGQLSALRANLEELRLEASIAEQQAKIQQIKKPALPAQLPLDLPALDAPKAPNKMKDVTPKEMETQVISIQGVGGRLTATLATKSGIRTVGVGDSIDGGRITSISRQGVVLLQGKRAETLRFKD